MLSLARFIANVMMNKIAFPKINPTIPEIKKKMYIENSVIMFLLCL